MTTHRTTLEKGKADRLYIMIDERNPSYALVKAGITSDTLKNRFHHYRTANPLLELVATCEIRKNQDLKTVESMFFEYLRNEKGYEHIFGEWVVIDNAEDIKAIKEQGFRFFEKLFYRTKNNAFYNAQVYKLWKCRPR